MSKHTCWDVKQCGKGPDSDDPCVVVVNSLSDGFLGGENGSRACFYVKGTRCFSDDANMTVPEKLKSYCLDCEFFKQVIAEEGIRANIFYYLKFIHERLEKEDRLHELPVIQNNLFRPKETEQKTQS